jgi:starch-binding outer membrane protein, SusD/RagB family
MVIMKFFIKNIFLFSLMICIISSCQKLDVSSPGDVPTSNVFKNADGLRSAVTGMYSTMQVKEYYGAYYPLMADLNSDALTQGGYDIPDLNEIGSHAMTPQNLYAERIYVAIYNTIATANAILQSVDVITDPNLGEGEKKTIKAQALAIRALGHFDLLRLYGYHWDLNSPNGIPLITSVQNATDIVKRSTVAEAYTAIINDLTDASGIIPADFKDAKYANALFIKGLLARVYLYKKDMVKAADFATQVINDGTFSLLDAAGFSTIYSGRLSAESIFELSFDAQNQSFYNGTTYVRPEALRTEIFFLANQKLDVFFQSRPGDKRSELVDFKNNDAGILPDGRTLKYRGEVTKDNPAYMMRIAEIYLIAAEAKKYAGGGLADINKLRESRGMDYIFAADVPNENSFLQAVLDERLSELNFEGHRFFDLARYQKIEDVLGVSNDYSVFPIPQREIIATNQQVTQNPGF